MIDTAVWWTGAFVIALASIAAIGFALLWLWANLIHDRFSAIFFREGKRRISLASWHQSKISMRGEDHSLDDWRADDHVIGPRPFYLSYKIGKRRLFIMAGTLGLYRHSSIKGRHP